MVKLLVLSSIKMMMSLYPIIASKNSQIRDEFGHLFVAASMIPDKRRKS